MAITQIIATLPAVLNDSETFYEDIAVRNNSLVTVSFPSINTWSTQANALAVEVNDKAAQVAAQAVDGGYSQTYINTNFVGVNNAQTIAGIKTFSSFPITPSTSPTTDYQVVNKRYVDDNNKINTLTNKTTPIAADEFVIADSDSSFSLKKLSFTNLKDNILPSGIVTMWSGSVISIPSGWALCDGSNNTPNLVDRFVVGAGSAYAVGATGGSANAVVVSHTHSASTDSQGSHTHSAWTDAQGEHSHLINKQLADAITGGEQSNTSAGGGLIGLIDSYYTSSAGNHGHNVGIGAAGLHGHNISVSTSGESGTNKNLPPYYALCYIMKT